MSELPTALYTPAQVRELDRRAIEDHGTPGEALMEHAGRAAYRLLRRRWPDACRVCVLCGGGNNGGDGYIVARLAARAGLTVRVVALSDPERLAGAAAVAMQRCREVVAIESWDPRVLDASDVVVDALLGTGLDRPVEGAYAEAIAAANALRAGRLAVDVPSGLSATTGAVLGSAFHADATVTFIGLKQGLLTADAPEYVGTLHFDGLDVPDTVYHDLTPAAERVDAVSVGDWLPARTATAHKGHFGHVLVVGGDHGFGGAVRLAAEAAARTGAGLVSAATRERHVAPLIGARPEVMAHAVAGADDMTALLERATVVALGPGLGRAAWSRELFRAALAFDGPLVVDADGLNLLAETAPTARPTWVLTPHPGEAARLLGCDTATVQADRFAAVAALSDRYGAAVVLKGAGTLVAAGGQRWVCSGGNAGMASGGMGDVLSGVIAALIAQGLPASRAAAMGVALHADAADRAATAGRRGLLASDLFAYLPS